MYEVLQPFIPFVVGFVLLVVASRAIYAYLNFKQGKPFEAYSNETGIMVCPNIGGTAALITEIHVKEEEALKKGEAIILIESGAAIMEIPSPVTGKLKTLHVKVGQRISAKNALLEFYI